MPGNRDRRCFSGQPTAQVEGAGGGGCVDAARVPSALAHGRAVRLLLGHQRLPVDPPEHHRQHHQPLLQRKSARDALPAAGRQPHGATCCRVSTYR